MTVLVDLNLPVKNSEVLVSLRRAVNRHLLSLSDCGSQRRQQGAAVIRLGRRIFVREDTARESRCKGGFCPHGALLTSPMRPPDPCSMSTF